MSLGFGKGSNQPDDHSQYDEWFLGFDGMGKDAYTNIAR